MTFGILTLATLADHKKAIGLALSLRVSNPGVPIAVACSPSLKAAVAPHFDLVVDELPNLKGFIHKLYLDKYSPFDETFFFDSDVFVFRPLSKVLNKWRDQPYTACGNYQTSGFSPFGLDRRKVLGIINRHRLVHIDGAGHAYFRKPECALVFELARDIAADYQNYAGNIKLADEDVMNIAMTLLDLRPMPHHGFWARYCSAKRGTIKLDAATADCSFEEADTGEDCLPYMMHFAANEAPFVYFRQLNKLYKKFGLGTKGLMINALHDFVTTEVIWPLQRNAKALLSELKP